MSHSAEEVQKVLGDINTRLLDYALGIVQLNPHESTVLINRRQLLEKAIRDSKPQHTKLRNPLNTMLR